MNDIKLEIICNGELETCLLPNSCKMPIKTKD